MRNKGAKNIKPRVVDAVISAKVLYPDMTADEILKHLSKYGKAFGINGASLPRLRTTQEIIKRNQDKINKGIADRGLDPLDIPWSIGSCLEYGISKDTIPILQRDRLCPFL